MDAVLGTRCQCISVGKKAQTLAKKPLYTTFSRKADAKNSYGSIRHKCCTKLGMTNGLLLSYTLACLTMPFQLVRQGDPASQQLLREVPEYVRLSRCRMTREGGPIASLTGGSSTRSVIFDACKTSVLASAQ